MTVNMKHLRNLVIRRGKVVDVEFEPYDNYCLSVTFNYLGQEYYMEEIYQPEDEMIVSYFSDGSTDVSIYTYTFHDLFKIGNKKLPFAVYNIGSATDCTSAELGECKIVEIVGSMWGCYAFGAEALRKYPLWYRRRQEVMFTRLSAERLAELMKEEIKDKTDVLRFNEAGEFRDTEDVEKVNKIAMYLSYYGISTYTYSARKFDWENINRDHMTIIGSAQWLDGQYLGVKNAKEKQEELKKIGIKSFLCPKDCRKCNACVTNKENPQLIISELI